MSFESLELQGRVKFTVVTPFSCVAIAAEMSWLGSTGGKVLAVAYLHTLKMGTKAIVHSQLILYSSCNPEEVN